MASNQIDMSNKVVLITGGSRGLGRAMALGFAEAGADLIITSRKIKSCEATAGEIEALEDQDDVDIVDPGTKEVDLVDRLHDAVVLELPLRLYCKTDCKGLCPQCGQDLNVDSCSCADDAIDPRWEALAQLKN